ncbi:hypothetical protein [Roseateles sp.]|uniref:hypothetical protein n=1 Tax=Roseateles sp. TaxID=1971397 RepID=UPI002DFD030D|nr:hypothetical protein [Roseateles sp.]
MNARAKTIVVVGLVTLGGVIALVHGYHQSPRVDESQPNAATHIELRAGTSSLQLGSPPSPPPRDATASASVGSSVVRTDNPDWSLPLTPGQNWRPIYVNAISSKRAGSMLLVSRIVNACETFNRLQAQRPNKGNVDGNDQSALDSKIAQGKISQSCDQLLEDEVGWSQVKRQLLEPSSDPLYEKYGRLAIKMPASTNSERTEQVLSIFDGLRQGVFELAGALGRDNYFDGQIYEYGDPVRVVNTQAALLYAQSLVACSFGEDCNKGGSRFVWNCAFYEMTCAAENAVDQEIILLARGLSGTEAATAKAQVLHLRDAMVDAILKNDASKFVRNARR